MSLPKAPFFTLLCAAALQLGCLAAASASASAAAVAPVASTARAAPVSPAAPSVAGASGASAASAASVAATRAVSDEEALSFDAFYLRDHPGQRGAAPVFSVTRVGKSWQVDATVDLFPTRGYESLCRMSRLPFRYDAAAKKGARWRADGPPIQFAWLDARAGCPVPANPVRLLQHVPDRDIGPLLRQAPALLLRARLLLAGSTACAELRSYRFTLAAIEIGAPDAGMEELHGLVFDSDHGRSAHVWVRPGAGELVAWNVSCPVGERR
jgi:hypothetical protein